MSIAENYNRHVFAVEAVQVTAENMQEIADWANGYVQQGMSVQVGGRLKEFTKDCVLITIGDGEHMKESKAYIGDWILMMDDGRIAQYKDEDFHREYSKQSEQQSTISDIIGNALTDAVYGKNPSQLIRNTAVTLVTEVFQGE